MTDSEPLKQIRHDLFSAKASDSCLCSCKRLVRKDGRYTYKYIDAFGKTKYVYAWKLLPTDKAPAGKRKDLSLREKEREIQTLELGQSE